MGVNHVEVNGTAVLDLRRDTITPEAVLSGVTAHNAAGEAITGTYAPPVLRVTEHRLTLAPASVQGTTIRA